MSHGTTLERRRFLAGMVTALAASRLGMVDFAQGTAARVSRDRATDPSAR
jgi:hypothetical protein